MCMFHPLNGGPCRGRVKECKERAKQAREYRKDKNRIKFNEGIKCAKCGSEAVLVNNGATYSDDVYCLKCGEIKVKRKQTPPEVK